MHTNQEITERAESMIGLDFLCQLDGMRHHVESVKLTETGFIIKTDRQLFTRMPSEAMDLMREFATPVTMKDWAKKVPPTITLHKNEEPARKKPGPAKGFKKRRELDLQQESERLRELDQPIFSPIHCREIKSVESNPVEFTPAAGRVLATLESTSDGVSDILITAMRRTVESPEFLPQARMLLDLVNAYDCQSE